MKWSYYFVMFFYLTLHMYLSGFASEVSKSIKIYNWSDYIARNSIKKFKDETGVSVIYDTFDSTEMLDAKLLSGNIGYDLVFPSDAPFLFNQIKLNLYQQINKQEIPNYQYLNPKIKRFIQSSDPGNKYTVPLMWTSTGIGYRADKILGIDKDAPIDSLKMIFDPYYAERFSECGIAWFNSPAEMIGLALIYNDMDPNNLTRESLNIARDTLKKARKHVKYILSDSYSDELAKGSVCLAVGWVGDIAQSKERYKESNSVTSIKYFLPKEGFFVSIDTMAIPAYADNVQDFQRKEAVYKFMNFLLDGKVAAINVNYTKHMSASLSANSYIDKDILYDNSLNPNDKTLKRGYSVKNLPMDILRKRNRIWTNILTDVN